MWLLLILCILVCQCKLFVVAWQLKRMGLRVHFKAYRCHNFVQLIICNTVTVRIVIVADIFTSSVGAIFGLTVLYFYGAHIWISNLIKQRALLLLESNVEL